jgi:hypothetical protein
LSDKRLDFNLAVNRLIMSEKWREIPAPYWKCILRGDGEFWLVSNYMGEKAAEWRCTYGKKRNRSK